jgi:hypothetical protein
MVSQKAELSYLSPIDTRTAVFKKNTWYRSHRSGVTPICRCPNFNSQADIASVSA